MAFQTPITIEKAVQGIITHEYVLPAIQREFVWKPEQACARGRSRASTVSPD